MLKILQSNQVYAIFIFLRLLVSVLLITPYIKNLINNKLTLQIFYTTIYDYIIMSFLVTCGALSLGTKFSLLGYSVGLLFSFLIILSLICVFFVGVNEIIKLNLSSVENYKNRIKNIILESTTVLSIFTIIITSVLISTIVQLNNNKLLSTVTFMLITIKILGHYYTKLGDIINDFKNKIINYDKEDKSLDEYSKIDNIGDLFGDCYGEIISFIIFACFLFKFTFLKTQLTYAHSSYLEKSYIICIIMYILSNKKKSIQKPGIILLVSILVLNLLDPIVKYFTYHGYNIMDISRFIIYNLSTQLYIVLPVLFILFVFRRVIQIIAVYLYNRSISIPVCGFIENISISVILSFIITTIAISSVMLARKYLFISYSSLFDIFSICGCICLFNTIFSTFADSANGVIKKRNMYFNNYNAEKDKITDEYLEELDNDGNILKLEAKIIMSYFVQVLICINSGLCNFNIKVNDLYIILVVMTIFSTFSKIIYESYISEGNKKYIYTLPFYTFLVLITGHIGINTVFNINKSYGYAILMLLTSISTFANISGSLFDCTKKKAEMENNINSDNYKIIVNNDIIGDFLKDTLGPSLFGIVISCFIYL